MQKHANLVNLVKSFPTNIYLQHLASIQKITSPVKFAHLAEKSENGSISNLSTKAREAELRPAVEAEKRRVKSLRRRVRELRGEEDARSPRSGSPLFPPLDESAAQWSVGFSQTADSGFYRSRGAPFRSPRLPAAAPALQSSLSSSPRGGSPLPGVRSGQRGSKESTGAGRGRSRSPGKGGAKRSRSPFGGRSTAKE